LVGVTKSSGTGNSSTSVVRLFSEENTGKFSS